MKRKRRTAFALIIAVLLALGACVRFTDDPQDSSARSEYRYNMRAEEISLQLSYRETVIYAYDCGEIYDPFSVGTQLRPASVYEGAITFDDTGFTDFSVSSSGGAIMLQGDFADASRQIGAFAHSARIYARADTEGKITYLQIRYQSLQGYLGVITWGNAD